MRKSIPLRLLQLMCLGICFTGAAFSQNARPVSVRDADQPMPGAPAERRPNLLDELGLTREQMQSVRRINQERKPMEQAARKRFQLASHELNRAIYADSIDEADVQTRLTEFQSAQAELARLKFANELAVRRLLTPAQLVKFREIRQRFAEERRGEAATPPGRQFLRRMRRGNAPPN